MRGILRGIPQPLATLVGAFLGCLLLLALNPVPRDPEFILRGPPPDSPVDAFGFSLDFPPDNEKYSNPTTPEKIELGRLLFFDPILSEHNDISCASCHHPDYGFSDGLPVAVGAGGQGAGPLRHGGAELARNTSALWNVAYESAMFRDARGDTLEYQVFSPLYAANEMGVTNTRELEDELKAIPEYVALFDEAFGNGTISINVVNVAKALAAFERSLLSLDSPYDRFAAGDSSALNEAQQRGLALFASPTLNCAQCHVPPTFASRILRVSGVGGSDTAFKVPTLRNIVLSGPYMHNGQYSSLEEVLAFYAGGAGRAQHLTGIDPLLRGFELNAQEQADLIAFLRSLRDEGRMPMVPERVPSGLPVIHRLENPARNDDIAIFTSQSLTDLVNEPRTFFVYPGESIQAALNQARYGDTVQVFYGRYSESLHIDFHGVRLLGQANAEGYLPILDGRRRLETGIQLTGAEIEIANFHLEDYTQSAIRIENSENLLISNLYISNPGSFGIHATASGRLNVQEVEVSGAALAAIACYGCAEVGIHASEMREGLVGLILENTNGAVVCDNHIHHNAGGVLVSFQPHHALQPSRRTELCRNRIEDHQAAHPGGLARLPTSLYPGVGISLAAADEVVLYANVLGDNSSAGIAIHNLSAGFEIAEQEVGPRPENVHSSGNQFLRNGLAPANELAAGGLSGYDILWDASGANVSLDEDQTVNVYPVITPPVPLPSALFNLYWGLVKIWAQYSN